MRLEGKTAIVTGAASGFGEGIARAFTGEGASVLLVDIADATSVEREIADSGGTAHSLRADVSLDADVERMVASAREELGGLDILVNNAGVAQRAQPLWEVDEELYDRIYAVNVKAIYLAARHAVPVFLAQGHGCIVNTSSTAAQRPRPGLTWYNSSKGAVHTMTKSMAVELGPHNIRVNSICPVIGETGMLETFMGTADTPEAREPYIAGIPLGRMSRPQDVANAAVFLASDETEFVTGVALEVDGGRSI
jgi:3-oxoacyl-[acyl-carrier protein] reductase